MLVVGSGCAGLTLSLSAKKCLQHVQIVDRRSVLCTSRRVVGIQPRVVPILQELGLEIALSPHVHVLHGNRIYSGGNLVEEVSFVDEASGKSPLIIRQGILERLLLEEAERQGQSVDLGVSAEGFVADGSVSVKLSGRGRAEVKDPRVVVACDGAQSGMRKAMEIPFENQIYGENSFMCDWELGDAFDDRYMHFFVADSERLVILPQSIPGLFRVSGCFDQRVISDSIDELVRLFSRIVGREPPGRAIDHFSFYKQSVGIAKVFGRFNGFLCGDAAHSFPPNGAQGINCAIEGAYHLGSGLAQNLTVEELQITYSRLRPIMKKRLDEAKAAKATYVAGKVEQIDKQVEEDRIRRVEL